MNKTMFRKLEKMPRVTNGEKLDAVILELGKLTELLRGDESHEGMFKKVERHDKAYYKQEGVTKFIMWGFPPVAIVAIIGLVLSLV